jgi:hypothetical protein
MFTITKKQHEKTGKDIWVAKLNEKVEKDQFKEISNHVKEMGGYYSRFVKGFVFKEDPEEKLKTMGMSEEKEPEKLVGGLADGKTIEYIAKMHNKDLYFMRKQLQTGRFIEMEHTNDPEKAKEIALDHLYESPDYYIELAKMEQKLEEEKNKYTLWIKTKKSKQSSQSSGYECNTIEECFEYAKKYRDDFSDLIIYITDKNNNIIISKKEFKDKANQYYQQDINIEKQPELNEPKLSTEEIKRDLSKLAPEISEYFYKIPENIRIELKGLGDFERVLAYFGFIPFKKYIDIDFEECQGLSVLRNEYQIKVAKEIAQNIQNNILELGFKYLTFKNPEKAIKDLHLKEYGIYEIEDEGFDKTKKIYKYFVYITEDNDSLFAVNGYSEQTEKETKDNFFKENYMYLYSNNKTSFDWINTYIMFYAEYVKDISFFYNSMVSFSEKDAKIILSKKQEPSEPEPIQPEQSTPTPTSEKPSNEGYEIVKRIRTLIDQNGTNKESYSPDELRLLRQYTGMGGYATRTERGTVDAGLLDQFYTPYNIIEKMFGLAFKHGFKFEGRKRIAEPATGIGRFLEYIPTDQEVVAYEIDIYAYTVAKISFPNFEIYNEPFETMFFRGKRRIGLRNIDEKFDLVIGNPPYREFLSKYALIEDASGASEKSDTLALTYDQYMLMRGVDILKEGGLLVFIIPSSFMANDKKYNNFKNLLAKKADLLESYRLPQSVFPNTQVTTDILVLRKK